MVFRDAVNHVTEEGYTVLMPALKGNKAQLSTEEVNMSRRVTKLRLLEATRPTRQHTENSHPTKDVKPIRSLRETKTRIERIVRTPTPPPRRMTRHHHEDSKEETMKLSHFRQENKQATRQTRLSSGSSKDTPKSILKVKTEDTFLLKPRELGKRTKEREQQKTVPVKKVKIAIKPMPALPKLERPERRRPATPPPALHRRSQAAAASPTSTPAPEDYKCKICDSAFVKPASLSMHMRSHSPCYTSSRLACNACGQWFNTSEETVIHHRWHRVSSTPYHCELCTADFRHHNAYNEHFEKKSCVPSMEVPDLKCQTCWGMYPTQNLLDQHKCPGEDGRPGGKCYKCLRTYATVRTLRKHEEMCRVKRRDDVTINPDMYATLRNVQIRFARCDPLLEYRVTDDGHYDVSGVKSTFGLDKKSEYPFFASARSVKIKLEPDEFDGMVNIKDDLLDLDETFVHWDSDDSGSSIEEVEDMEESNIVVNPFARRNKRPRVESLARLSIKTIFSAKFLGKVPKRKRKLKFENLKTESDFESLLRKNINEELKSELTNYMNRKNEDNLNTTVHDNTKMKTLNKNHNTNYFIEKLTENANKSNEINDAEEIDTENFNDCQRNDDITQKARSSKDGDNDRTETIFEETSNEDTDLTKNLEKCNGNVEGIREQNENKSEEWNKSEESIDESDANFSMKLKTRVETDPKEGIMRRSETQMEENVEISCTNDRNTNDVESDDDHDDTLSDVDKHRLDESKENTDDVTSKNYRQTVEKTKEITICDSNDMSGTNEVNVLKSINCSNFEIEQSNKTKAKYSNKLDADPTVNDYVSVNVSSKDDSVLPQYERKRGSSHNGDVKGDMDEISDNELGDVSDSELDDNKLLEALDKQIDDIGSGKTVGEEAEETLIDNHDNSKGLQVYNEELSNEKDSQGSLRYSGKESTEDFEQGNEEEEDLTKNAQSTDISLEDSKDKLEGSSDKSRLFLEENSEDSNLRDHEENSAVIRNDSRKDFEIPERDKDKTHLLDATSNSNSLDTPDKCLRFITHEREKYLLDEKTEDISSRDESEKINIEDIVTSRTDKSMDLDSISDEDFDFDT
ncbi:Zinc finger protein ZFP69 [Eumeta japonica]|uniref:Zinc finger protein ZFP69 n=1 Tax=Eumeta variegata TaxID=151549 RepID=A0A4C1WIW2_EUMVA|nr:Zinc finger protein ZFP69 [Eumeta japonica]